MKKRVDTRTLCGACRLDYRNSGYALTKISGQTHKEECDICRVRKGWEYEVDDEEEGCTEETHQTIGKTNYIVVSHFNASGRCAKDNITNLLQREAQNLSGNSLDKASQARYTELANAG